jgi:hypothetical protein
VTSQQAKDKLMTLRGDGMTQSQLVGWSKEMVLDGIDRHIYRLEHDGAMPLDYDELAQVVKQRNRIARLFNMKERGAYEITGDHDANNDD